MNSGMETIKSEDVEQKKAKEKLLDKIKNTRFIFVIY